jgi:type I restriction enzyme M protein
MITGAGALKSQVDQVWNAFWSGGISNPLTVIGQITYLLFTKRLDEIHTGRERRANRLGRPHTVERCLRMISGRYAAPM